MMVNFWLVRRLERKLRLFEEAICQYLYLTYGHARLSALTSEEFTAIMPMVMKYRDKYGLESFSANALLRDMMKRQKWSKL
jgi:hypothetical protein